MRTVMLQVVLLASLSAGCSAGKKGALEMCDSSDPKARHSAVAELMRHLSSEAGSTEEEVSASFTGDDAIFDLEGCAVLNSSAYGRSVGLLTNQEHSD